MKMSNTKVDRRRKIKKHTQWLKRPKLVPQKILTKMLMIQNLIFVILFLKILFQGYNFSPHVPMDIIKAFFSHFVAENLKANKN